MYVLDENCSAIVTTYATNNGIVWFIVTMGSTLPPMPNACVHCAMAMSASSREQPSVTVMPQTTARSSDAKQYMIYNGTYNTNLYYFYLKQDAVSFQQTAFIHMLEKETANQLIN